MILPALLVMAALALAGRARRGSAPHPPEHEIGTADAEAVRLRDDFNDRHGLDLTLDEYSLARVIMSEAGQRNDETQQWIGWAVRNEAVERMVSVHHLATDGDGQYQSQTDAGGFVATRQEPGRLQGVNAMEVMEELSDPTRGVRRFFSPRSQDFLNKTQPDRVTKNAEELIASRRSEGWVVAADGPDNPRFTTFFRRAA